MVISNLPAIDTTTTKHLYVLVNMAYGKIMNEADRPDPCIRRVVGQANFIDRLAIELEHRRNKEDDEDVHSPSSDSDSEKNAIGLCRPTHQQPKRAKGRSHG